MIRVALYVLFVGTVGAIIGAAAVYILAEGLPEGARLIAILSPRNYSAMTISS